MAEIAERLSLLPPPHPECGRTETWVKHSDGREDPSHESGKRMGKPLRKTTYENGKSRFLIGDTCSNACFSVFGGVNIRFA